MVVRVGVIGAGRIVPHHLKVLVALQEKGKVEINAIANRTLEKAETLAKEYGIQKVYSSHAELVKNEKVDALYVLTSADSICKVTLDCLEYGIPLFIEKPAGLMVEDTQKIAAKAREKGVEVMVGFNRRFMSTMQKAQQICEEGKLQSIIIEAPERFAQAVEVHGTEKEIIKHWMAANSTHCLDLFQFFARERKDEVVRCDVKQKRYHALLEFTDNKTGHFYADWNCPGNWSVILVTDKHKITLLPLEKGAVLDKERNNTEIFLSKIDQEFKPGFYKQAEYFVEAVNQKSEINWPACNIDDAVKTMRLVDRLEKGK